MTGHAKQLLVGLIAFTAISFMIMRVGPRACVKDVVGTNQQIGQFATLACEAVVRADEKAFLELVVTDGDLSADEKYGWFPYSGADRDSFEPWRKRALAEFRKATSEIAKDRAVCRDVRSIERADAALDRQQGRVPSIRIAVATSGSERILELRSTVRAHRGRVFQGLEHAHFIVWDTP